MTTPAHKVTVGTTPTRLDTSSGSSDRTDSSLIGFNDSAVTIYIGDSDVATAQGLPIPAGTWTPGYELDASEALYGIVASGTAEMRVHETSV